MQRRHFMRVENELRKKRVAARRAPCVRKQKKKKSHQERRRFRKEMQHVQKHNRQKGVKRGKRRHKEAADAIRVQSSDGCGSQVVRDQRRDKRQKESSTEGSPQRGVLGSTLEGWRGRSQGTTPKKRAHSVEIKFCWQSWLNKTRPPTTSKTHTHTPCTAPHKGGLCSWASHTCFV